MHSHNAAVFKPTLHFSALAMKTKPCTAVDDHMGSLANK